MCRLPGSSARGGAIAGVARGSLSPDLLFSPVRCVFHRIRGMIDPSLKVGSNFVDLPAATSRVTSPLLRGPNRGKI
jgi:hypothetical protein